MFNLGFFSNLMDLFLFNHVIFRFGIYIREKLFWEILEIFPNLLASREREMRFKR